MTAYRQSPTSPPPTDKNLSSVWRKSHGRIGGPVPLVAGPMGIIVVSKAQRVPGKTNYAQLL